MILYIFSALFTILPLYADTLNNQLKFKIFCYRWHFLSESGLFYNFYPFRIEINDSTLSHSINRLVCIEKLLTNYFRSKMKSLCPMKYEHHHRKITRYKMIRSSFYFRSICQVRFVTIKAKPNWLSIQATSREYLKCIFICTVVTVKICVYLQDIV